MLLTPYTDNWQCIRDLERDKTKRTLTIGLIISLHRLIHSLDNEIQHNLRRHSRSSARSQHNRMPEKNDNS